jgi:4-hydroxyproline epimerase
MKRNMKKVHVIDSHTGGEPTRLVVAGGPELMSRNVVAMRDELARDHDAFRAGVILEPRGTDVLVGALLTERPSDVGDDVPFGLIFFNNTGYLGMCGHGLIGVAETLRWMGRIGLGTTRFATPVGVVSATIFEDGQIEIENVVSYRIAANVVVEVSGMGCVTGDVAWGGNTFFLIHTAPPVWGIGSVAELTRLALLARDAVHAAGYPEVDHVEWFGKPVHEDSSSANFVLCPGGAVDRSPCGTGTSAKLACLHAAGRLEVGQVWRQEGITGSVFEGRIAAVTSEGVVPLVRGRAWVTAESSLVFGADDPLFAGLRWR